MSTYTDESGIVRNDQDRFRLTLPVGGVGKIKFKLHLTGDRFDAFIQGYKMKQDNAPCGDFTDYRLIYAGRLFPTSYNPIVYDITRNNLDEGDYRIEVSATNLASNMGCGSGEIYSYKLSVTQIDMGCIRNGSYCGTWRLGAADDGCYKDKTSYNKNTLIGFSVSLSILQHCLSEFFFVLLTL